MIDITPSNNPLIMCLTLRMIDSLRARMKNRAKIPAMHSADTQIPVLVNRDRVVLMLTPVKAKKSENCFH